MVALASDWRLAEERAQRFMNPARVVERYRQVTGVPSSRQLPSVSYRQMLTAVVEHDLGEGTLPDPLVQRASE